MLIYGLNPVLYYLKNFREDVKRLYISADIKAAESICSAAGGTVPIEKVNSSFFQQQLGLVNHQGIAAEVAGIIYHHESEIISTGSPLYLLLDQIQDPQNLGAILRTAEALGIDGVIIPKDRAAEVTPAVIRASSGAARGVRIFKVVNLTRTIEALKEKGFWIAAVETEEGAIPYYDYDLTGPAVIILGAEGRGIRRLPKKSCDIIITIPMMGRVESFNVSAAAAIILSEAIRQRRMKDH